MWLTTRKRTLNGWEGSVTDGLADVDPIWAFIVRVIESH